MNVTQQHLVDHPNLVRRVLERPERRELPPRAEVVSTPIFRPDLPDAENRAALENVVRFFSILLEWEAASTAKLHNAHCNAEAP